MSDGSPPRESSSTRSQLLANAEVNPEISINIDGAPAPAPASVEGGGGEGYGAPPPSSPSEEGYRVPPADGVDSPPPSAPATPAAGLGGGFSGSADAPDSDYHRLAASPPASPTPNGYGSNSNEGGNNGGGFTNNNNNNNGQQQRPSSSSGMAMEMASISHSSVAISMPISTPAPAFAPDAPPGQQQQIEQPVFAQVAIAAPIVAVQQSIDKLPPVPHQHDMYDDLPPQPIDTASTAGGVTAGKTSDKNFTPPAETAGPADTIHNIKINYNFTKNHQVMMFIGFGLMFAGMCCPFMAKDSWTLDVMGNVHGDVSSSTVKIYSSYGYLINVVPLNSSSLQTLLDPTRPLFSGATAVGALASIFYFFAQPWILHCLKKKTYGATERRSVPSFSIFLVHVAYFAISVSGTILHGFCALMGIYLMIKLPNDPCNILNALTASRYSYSDNMCSLSYGLWMYTIGGCLAFLCSFILILRNKYIPHALSLAFNILLLGALIYAWDHSEIVALYFAAGIWFFYMIEACGCHTMKYLRNILSVESASQWVSRIRGVPPYIWMHVACYHYETRTRTVQVSDGRGGYTTRTETYTVRVDTYSEEISFKFTSWMDVSGDIIGLEKYPLTKLNLFKSYTFRDDRTRNAFLYDAAQFRARNRHRDTHMDYSDGMNVAGFKDKLLALTDISKKPCWVSPYAFFFISFFGFSYFYRMFLDWMSVKKGFWFVKEVAK